MICLDGNDLRTDEKTRDALVLSNYFQTRSVRSSNETKIVIPGGSYQRAANAVSSTVGKGATALRHR